MKSLYSCASPSTPVPGNNVDYGDYSLYNISYLYYAMVGCLVAFSVGLVVSLATKHLHEAVRDERLLLPFVRRFWSPSQTDASRQTEKQGDPETHSIEGLQTQEQLITTEVFPKPFSDML
ncbi:uncharacterized protein [Haliotis cracherodii]|uniref:uncharacterized protein n=1 Tax=Haliotis cracherodii TaxID=6455 RepID=UPI0039ED4134